MNDVAYLGFENYVENEEIFFSAANRALSLIYVDRPVSDTAVITVKGPRISVLREYIEHFSGDVIDIPFSGMTLSFRTSGSGYCVVSDPTGSNNINFSGTNQLSKQFIYGDGKISFRGDFYYVIRHFAVYKDQISNSSVDIPEFLPYREIKPSDYCDNFRAFAGLPHDINGSPIECAKLVDGRVRLPSDYRGELYLTYYRSPAPLDIDDYDSEIDISKECEPMLPLLTASFMWLDDDAAKAQYYMSLYRDLMANVKRFSTNKIDTQYSVNGWA